MSDELKTRLDRASEAVRWWRNLQDMKSDGTPNPRADRASRARLRRADVDTATTEEAVLALYRSLAPSDKGFDARRMRMATRLALVLSHVRPGEGQPKRFAQQLGRSSFSAPLEEAILKPLRFQRLLAAREEEDIVREFRRAVDLAGNRVDVRDLAGLLLNWEFDETRTRFAFDYFAAGSAAPTALDNAVTSA